MHWPTSMIEAERQASAGVSMTDDGGAGNLARPVCEASNERPEMRPRP